MEQYNFPCVFLVAQQRQQQQKDPHENDTKKKNNFSHDLKVLLEKLRILSFGNQLFHAFPAE